MQQCWMVMHDDAHDQVFVAFNIWDVTMGALLMMIPTSLSLDMHPQSSPRIVQIFSRLIEIGFLFHRRYLVSS
jgi:hypothetical protein